MILLVQADFERLQRVWFYKLVSTSSPPTPTQKSILSLYVSTVDRIIALDKESMQKAVELAIQHDGCSQEKIINLLDAVSQKAIPRGQPASTATQVLKALIARMVHLSNADDRVRIAPNALHVLNFLHTWFQGQPADRQQEQPGGAPAIIAQVLTQLNEPNVVLWTAYHSQKQAGVFDQKVKFLVIDEQGNLSVQPIGDVGRLEDPEIRNYSLEFAKDTQFELKRSNGKSVSIPVSPAPASDRVIAISPGYRFFDSSSEQVDPENVPSNVIHILAANLQQGPSYAAQVAQSYKYWIIGGLHHVSNPENQQRLESNLQSLRASDVIIHVEIPKRDISTWFQHVLKRYVKSVGINVQDIEGVARTVAHNSFSQTKPPESSLDFREEYFLELALWLACELDLERVYVHGLELDYLVRRDDTSVDEMNREMNQEVNADLLAKLVVANRARGVGVFSQTPKPFGISAQNLVAFVKVCFLRAYPAPAHGWVTLEDISVFKPVLDRGWFETTFEYQGQAEKFRVAIIPVALFRLDPGDLKFVGAGDTTSAISFVFGYYNSAGT